MPSAPGHFRPAVCFSPSCHSCQGTTEEETCMLRVSLKQKRVWQHLGLLDWRATVCSHSLLTLQVELHTWEGAVPCCPAEPAQSLEKDLELFALFSLEEASNPSLLPRSRQWPWRGPQMLIKMKSTWKKGGGGRTMLNRKWPVEVGPCSSPHGTAQMLSWPCLWCSVFWHYSAASWDLFFKTQGSCRSTLLGWTFRQQWLSLWVWRN